MMTASTSPLGSQINYTFVATVSRYQGLLLLCRHRARTTWETQGGHIEPGETPLAAAKRELYEESGALDYVIQPVCDYSAAGTHGMLFFADVKTLGPLPPSEMAEVRTFEALPQALTYPGITPIIVDRAWRKCTGRGYLENL